MYRFLASTSAASLLDEVGSSLKVAYQSVVMRGLRLRIRRPFLPWIHDAAGACMFERAAGGPESLDAV